MWCQLGYCYFVKPIKSHPRFFANPSTFSKFRPNCIPFHILEYLTPEICYVTNPISNSTQITSLLISKYLSLSFECCYSQIVDLIDDL